MNALVIMPAKNPDFSELGGKGLYLKPAKQVRENNISDAICFAIT
jgi:hypothetical protein